MPRPLQLDPATLLLRLQSQGPLTAQALADAAGVDRSRVSRGLTGLGAPIVRLGVTRGARYALRRPVRGLGDTFLIRRIDAEGRAQDWAELTALHGGWRVTWAHPQNAPAWADARLLALGGWSEGFPFFLSDIRPQGYLGRAVGRGLPPVLGLDPDPRNWGDDDTLAYLQTEGEDLPGDLVVGDFPLHRIQERALQPAPSHLSAPERAEHYPLNAVSALAPRGGSSVEGEQPKFLATLAGAAAPEHVIVKFTDTLSTPTGRRWADLLVGEAHALTVLHENGESHAAPRLLDAGERRFFETPRFDRVGAHGRRGVVSLRGLHDAFAGPDANAWLPAAANLLANGLIDAAALRSIRLRHAFGVLIGNSDMHLGNLAFWLDDTLPLRLAPAYDMLPMLWAPVAGNATPRPVFAPAPPLPAEREYWSLAAGWAEDFWQRVATDSRVSPEFALIAREAGETVRHLRTHFAAR
jgi:hypothetical protein